MFDQDQAAGLRALFARERPDVIVGFGAGRAQAVLLTALARQMAGEGSKVLMIDGSAGLAAAQLGLRCRYELSHVLAGDKDLSEVLRTAQPSITLLPALRGLDQLVDLPREAALRMRQQFAFMFDQKDAHIDAILVNCKPLSAVRALDAFSARAHLLMVLEPGIAGLTTAYQEIKALNVAHQVTSCDVVLVPGANHRSGMAAFQRLQATTFDFLGVTLNLQRGQHGVLETTLYDQPLAAADLATTSPMNLQERFCAPTC